MAQELTPKDKQEIKGQEQTRPGRIYIPSVDIWEDENGLTLRADMPGVTPDKVSVELEEDSLIIEGEVDLAEYRDMSPVYTEYNVGHYQRRFSIPQSGRYDREGVRARHTDGVLEVTVPHAEAAKPRRITVSTG